MANRALWGDCQVCSVGLVFQLKPHPCNSYVLPSRVLSLAPNHPSLSGDVPGHPSWAENVFHTCSVPWESTTLFPANVLPHPEDSRYISTPGFITFIGVSRELAASPASSAAVSGESPQWAGTGPRSTLVMGYQGTWTADWCSADPRQMDGESLATIP